MTYLRRRPTREQSKRQVVALASLFDCQAPKGTDTARSKVVASPVRGRMTAVRVFYKKAPKSLSLEFVGSPAARIV